MAEALTACFDLPADPRAAGRARRLISELLTAWGRSDTAEVAQLLVSEVVTNAVRFVGTRDALCVTLSLHDDRIRFAVADGSSLRPVLKPAHDDDESGRGMHLVAALAMQWGIVEAPAERGPGKQVWFELPRQQEPMEAVCPS